CDLRGGQGFAALEEGIVDRTSMPVDLVDGPWHGRRFLQPLDARGFLSGQRLRERGARGDEFVERPLIQDVDLGLEGRHQRIETPALVLRLPTASDSVAHGEGTSGSTRRAGSPSLTLAVSGSASSASVAT